MKRLMKRGQSKPTAIDVNNATESGIVLKFTDLETGKSVNYTTSSMKEALLLVAQIVNQISIGYAQQALMSDRTLLKAVTGMISIWDRILPKD